MDMPSGSTMPGIYSNLRDFYKDRSIFITGASGFMGKVLVEKLLWSCTQIRSIYILLRPKSGSDVRSRLEQLLSGKVFDRVKKDQPDAVRKVVAISGDITMPGLGISATDEKTLADNVSVVFHAAATVKFDEGLKQSVDMNVQGTRRLVHLCHKMPKLEALVHVSTAYCNCDRNDEIEETVYPLPHDPQHIIGAMEWMSDAMVDDITPRLLQNRPNTYTYTKALVENILMNERGSLPLAIVRPSIVVAALHDPFPGWVDSLNGITGIMLQFGKGVLQTLHAISEMAVDLVPVDLVINLMISVAWYTASVKLDEVTVYNCTTGTVNRLPWNVIQDMCVKNFIANPFNDVLWYPRKIFNGSRLYNDIVSTFLPFLPAYWFDVIRWVTGKKPFLVKFLRNVKKSLPHLEYFSTHEWRFANRNLWTIWDAMSAEDRQLFNFDLRQLHWPTFFENYCLGIKLYVLKEDITTLPSARRRLRKMYFVRQLSRLVRLLVVWRLLMIRFEFARRLWFYMLSTTLRLIQMLPKKALASVSHLNLKSK